MPLTCHNAVIHDSQLVTMLGNFRGVTSLPCDELTGSRSPAITLAECCLWVHFIDKMSSAKNLEANWSHIHMHKLIYGGYAGLSFLNSEGFPASSVSLELRTRRCMLTTEKPGL